MAGMAPAGTGAGMLRAKASDGRPRWMAWLGSSSSAPSGPRLWIELHNPTQPTPSKPGQVVDCGRRGACPGMPRPGSKAPLKIIRKPPGSPDCPTCLGGWGPGPKQPHGGPPPSGGELAPVPKKMIVCGTAWHEAPRQATTKLTRCLLLALNGQSECRNKCPLL